MEFCWVCGGKLEIIRDRSYHYRECGLDNVYLYGIIQYRCPECGEEAPEIPELKGLHLLIAKELVCKGELMEGTEIRFLRKELRLKSKEMAELLSVTPETYSRWENSREIISEGSDSQLRYLYILNAEDKTGKILHEGIRFARSLASKKLARKIRNGGKTEGKKPVKIDISISEWVMPHTGPIFTEECY